jgi:hypothetical protein
MMSSFEMLLNSDTREAKTEVNSMNDSEKKVALCVSYELRLTLHLDSFVQVLSSVRVNYRQILWCDSCHTLYRHC